MPFAEIIERAKKYVVSTTLSGVEWNAELVRGTWTEQSGGSSGNRARAYAWVS